MVVVVILQRPQFQIRPNIVLFKTITMQHSFSGPEQQDDGAEDRCCKCTDQGDLSKG